MISSRRNTRFVREGRHLIGPDRRRTCAQECRRQVVVDVVDEVGVGERPDDRRSTLHEHPQSVGQRRQHVGGIVAVHVDVARFGSRAASPGRSRFPTTTCGWCAYGCPPGRRAGQCRIVRNAVPVPTTIASIRAGSRGRA